MKCEICGYCPECEGETECPIHGPTAEAQYEERLERERDEKVDSCARGHYKSLSGA